MFISLSANALDLDPSKILVFGKELNYNDEMERIQAFPSFSTVF